MADRVTDIVSKSGTVSSKYDDYILAMRKTFETKFEERSKAHAEEIRKRIADEKKGDSFQKKVDATKTKYEDKIKNSVAPYLKKRTNAIVALSMETDPNIKKAEAEAYDKYIDEFVKNSCAQIDAGVTSLEEYRIVAESVIRSCHDIINNDPEMKEEIRKQIRAAIKDGVARQAAELMNSKFINNLVLREDMYITKLATIATNIANSGRFFTAVQIDDIITASTKRASENLAKSISENTFGKLAKLPLVGSAFKSLQTASESAISKGIQDIVNRKMTTSWAAKIKDIKAYQTRASKIQEAANAAIRKAQEKARVYTKQLEQKAIDQIKKYVSLDNISIGGFKL